MTLRDGKLYSWETFTFSFTSTLSVLLVSYQAVNIAGNRTVMQHAKHATGYRPVLHVVTQRNVRRSETLFLLVIHVAARTGDLLQKLLLQLSTKSKNSTCFCKHKFHCNIPKTCNSGPSLPNKPNSRLLSIQQYRPPIYDSASSLRVL